MIARGSRACPFAAVFEFEPREGERVRITVSGVGYREGESYQRVRKLFEQGNVWTLRKLRADLVKARADH